MLRRDFLKSSLALGCSAAASPLVTPVAFASAPWDSRLVVIVLRGAMDGLDVVQPYGDLGLRDLRPTLALTPDSGLIDLDGFYGMNASLDPLRPLWDRGELGFVHAVSTPYRDKRSHFDGQDILEAGGPDKLRDGWLNRMVANIPGVNAEFAYAVGREQMLILSGDAQVSRWAPDLSFELSEQVEYLLGRVYENDPLFATASSDAIAIAKNIMDAGDDGFEPDMGMMQGVGRGNHVQLAEFAAERLRGDSRIASFSLSGWDTHANQKSSLKTPLNRLSQVILALRANLGSVWDKTAVIAMTEFGRTARENGVKGTDHGTGGLMITAGGAIRGGRVVADWPGLGEGDLYADRDLMPTRDVRSASAWIMRGLFSLPDDVIRSTIFPEVDLGTDPKFFG